MVQILLAVEDPLLRNLLADRLVQETDFQITGAVGDPESLLEVVQLSHPDVIILDLQWSAVSGLALLERVLLNVPEAMFLTLVSEEAEESQIQAAQNGARGVVTKTEGITVLPQAIRALGRGEVWFTRQVSRRIFQEYHRLARQLREQEQPLAGLSVREREVLSHIAGGLTNRDIAEQLHMSVHTVKLHVQHILQKLELPNRTDAAVFAVREGLVSSLPRRIAPKDIV
ncbi:response regulator transcription factor [Armatimonas sp.]|uniref:response regulator transcription factor n=1 Tax=Armatimonas sp. TaxID=1872638 RepID=UPI00286BD2FC|nr:response regulator transcription factor [Armatimonas sp.]